MTPQGSSESPGTDGIGDPRDDELAALALALLDRCVLVPVDAAAFVAAGTCPVGRSASAQYLPRSGEPIIENFLNRTGHPLR